MQSNIWNKDLFRESYIGMKIGAIELTAIGLAFDALQFDENWTILPSLNLFVFLENLWHTI